MGARYKFGSANLITVASPGFLHEKKDGDFQKWYAGLNHPKLPVVTDNGGTIAQKPEYQRLPSWALIGKDGDVQRIVKGSINEAQALALIRDPSADLGRLKTRSTNPTHRKRIQKSRTRAPSTSPAAALGLEAYFQRIDGVVDAVSGYANGKTKNPSYEDVSYRDTGHAETVKVTYDADKRSLDDILQYFFRVVDPTSLNKQGNDTGTQYRSGVYYTDPAEKAVIAAALKREQQNTNSPSSSKTGR